MIFITLIILKKNTIIDIIIPVYKKTSVLLTDNEILYTQSISDIYKENDDVFLLEEYKQLTRKILV